MELVERAIEFLEKARRERNMRAMVENCQFSELLP